MCTREKVSYVIIQSLSRCVDKSPNVIIKFSREIKTHTQRERGERKESFPEQNVSEYQTKNNKLIKGLNDK